MTPQAMTDAEIDRLVHEAGKRHPPERLLWICTLASGAMGGDEWALAKLKALAVEDSSDG